MSSTELQPSLVNEGNFPQIKYYIITAVFFIDIGILFGGLNALRLAKIFNVHEIHQTHWTSTLFGGMTVIMMGQLLYFLSLSIELPKWVEKGSILVLIIILLGLGSNYIDAWYPLHPLGNYFVDIIKLASFLYLLMVVYLLVRGERRYPLSQEPSYIMIIAALFWMGVAQLIYLGHLGDIGPKFRVPYIYGFFSLTLFASLSFVLPRITNTTYRPRGTIIRDTSFISLSALLLLLNEIVDSYNTLLGLLGTIFWGIVGFLFILYVFDLMYKSGMSNSLIGLAVALVMFGFFVFDTLMKAVFPHWVNASHAHFMFLGTLVITILSIGTQLIQKEMSHVNITDRQTTVIITISLVLIGTILLGFTLQMFAVAGYAGILLFVSLVLFEFQVIYRVLFRN